MRTLTQKTNLKTTSMKNFILITTMLIPLFFFNSCNQDDVNENNNYLSEKISKKDAQKIAYEHNKYLELIFKDFNFSSNNLEQELKINVEKLSSEYQTDLELQKVFNFSISNEKETLSKNLNEYLNKTESVIDLSKNTNNIYMELDAVFESFKNKFSSIEEYNYAIVHLETTKKSIYFWFPENLGGSGKGYAIINKLKRVSKVVSCSDAVVASDGMAAGSSLIIGAITAAVAGGPVGAGAFFGMVGLRAAVASASTALVAC